MVLNLSEIVALNQNSDFRRIYARGKCFADKALVTYVMKNRLGITRCGITAGKKVGNAVERNRSRRVIRAAFSALEKDVSCGYDIIFVARGKTKFLKSQIVQKAMLRHLRDAGVIGQ